MSALNGSAKDTIFQASYFFFNSEKFPTRKCKEEMYNIQGTVNCLFMGIKPTSTSVSSGSEDSHISTR